MRSQLTYKLSISFDLLHFLVKIYQKMNLKMNRRFRSLRKILILFRYSIQLIVNRDGPSHVLRFSAIVTTWPYHKIFWPLKGKCLISLVQLRGDDPAPGHPLRRLGPRLQHDQRGRLARAATRFWQNLRTWTTSQISRATRQRASPATTASTSASRGL